MSYLVTGSKGLIGGEICNRIDCDGIDRGDAVPDKKYSTIIHCASNCVVRKIIEDPGLGKENVDYSFRIFEKARRDNSKIIAFSSARVMHEDNPYTISKKFIEGLCKAYHNCYGLEYLIIRPETVWGRKEVNVRVINTWINAVRSGKPCKVFGDEEKRLSPIHVKDFVDVFLKALGDFEVGKVRNEMLYITGEPIKATEIITEIGWEEGVVPMIEFYPPEITQPQDTSGAGFGSDFKKQLKLG